MNNIFRRFTNMVNLFIERQKVRYSGASYTNPDRARFSSGNERSIVTSIYNRIALDVAQLDYAHVKNKENSSRYEYTIADDLHRCLTLSANIDQTGRDLIRDFAIQILDDGVAALICTDWYTEGPLLDLNRQVCKLRVGRIVQWYPTAIRAEVYNENTGQKETIDVEKKFACIVENPYYTVMNEPNSTLRRLIRKLNLLDYVDEQSGSGKLDIICQLPYPIRTERQKNEAEERRLAIEKQLNGSKYGIAYIDGTEKITQLNRAAENNLLTQVQMLTEQLYSQLGLTEEIMNGTASTDVLTTYYDRTIEPIASAIVNEMNRKFIHPDKYDNGERVTFTRNPFRIIPVTQLADIADKLTRNAILAPNEVRQIIGYAPVDNQEADELRNRNISESKEQISNPVANPDNIEIKPTDTGVAIDKYLT